MGYAMKMIVMQELAVQNDVKVLDLFAEHGAPAGTEEIWVSVDGRHVFAIGDYEDLADWNRIGELYQSAYSGPARFFPVVGPDVAVANTRAGIAART
jgi:hypothetical protein